jgi:hypothetical protein
MEVQARAARCLVGVHDNEIRAAGAGLAAHAALLHDNRSGWFLGLGVLSWVRWQPEDHTARIKSRLRRTVNLDLARMHRGSRARLNATVNFRVMNMLL